MRVSIGVVDEKLRTAALDIAGRVAAAGGRAMMVGGSVRDLLLGRRGIKDIDIEVFGLSADGLRGVLKNGYDFDECGAAFGVLKVKHLDIDVSLPRRESKCGFGHKGFLVDSDPGMTIAEAASRRDFTVNAIYYDPIARTLEDPFGGVADLENGVLRHVSEKFREDPLRVLRGMQFVARFGLRPAPETVEMCRTMDIEGLAPERIFEEWGKLLLKGTRIGDGLRFLKETGWVAHFPELSRLIGCRQDPEWHPEGDVWEHTCLCLDAFARRRIGDEYEDLVVGLAVICHDFGKPDVTMLDPVKKRICSPGHDEAGVGHALSFLRRMTNEERILRDVPPLVKCHMRPYSMWRAKAGPSAIRRLALAVGRIDRLLRVARADSEGRPPELSGGPSGGDDLAWLAEEAEKLRIADSAPKPILMGRHLMEMGYAPSEKFGEWLKACFEAQLDGVFADVEGAKRYFMEHVADGQG